MPQLDIFFFLPTVLYLLLVFFILLFYCHYAFLPKMAALLKMRHWEPIPWPFPAILQIEVIGEDEFSDFLEDDDSPLDVAHLIEPLSLIEKSEK